MDIWKFLFLMLSSLFHLHRKVCFDKLEWEQLDFKKFVQLRGLMCIVVQACAHKQTHKQILTIK